MAPIGIENYRRRGAQNLLRDAISRTCGADVSDCTARRAPRGLVRHESGRPRGVGVVWVAADVLVGPEVDLGMGGKVMSWAPVYFIRDCPCRTNRAVLK